MVTYLRERCGGRACFYMNTFTQYVCLDVVINDETTRICLKQFSNCNIKRIKFMMNVNMFENYGIRKERKRKIQIYRVADADYFLIITKLKQ